MYLVIAKHNRVGFPKMPEYLMLDCIEQARRVAKDLALWRMTAYIHRGSPETGFTFVEVHAPA